LRRSRASRQFQFSSASRERVGSFKQSRANANQNIPPSASHRSVNLPPARAALSNLFALTAGHGIKFTPFALAVQMRFGFERFENVLIFHNQLSNHCTIRPVVKLATPAGRRREGRQAIAKPI
jgi:hypothetical protein